MSYIGNSPGVASQRVVTTFTATAGQTTFTPSSGYTLGYCDVFFNGVKLVNGDDYTASNGTSVVLASASAAGDSVEIVAHFPRGLSDGYLKSEADARYPRVDTASQGLNSTQQSNARTNIGAQAALGYTPVNKAGDNLTGGSFQLSNFITLQANDANGYPRINGAGSSAQLGLFRSAGGTEGGMYIGANGSEFAVWDQNFNRRLIVDQSGRVTTPQQPAFHLTGLTQDLYASNGSGEINVWNNVNLNVGSQWNNSTGRFTAPVGGIYLIQFDPMYKHLGGDITFQIWKNGTAVAYNNPHARDDGGYAPPWHNAPVTWIGRLEANEYISFAWYSSGHQSTYIYASGLYTRAMGRLLG